MSVHAMSWVFRESPVAVTGHRLVLLVLADYAHDDGTCAWPSVETIASKARMSERAVRYALRRLEADGAIERTGKSKSGTYVYSVVMDESSVEGANIAGGQNGAGNVSQIAPEPPVNHQEESSPDGEPKKLEPPEFGEWIGHHSITTGMTVLRAGTQVRARIAAMFRQRQGEGYSLEDLKLATVGAFSDDFRRERGYYDPESVLRPTKVAKLVEAGRRAAEKAASTSAYAGLTVN